MFIVFAAYMAGVARLGLPAGPFAKSL